jgi:hypothetical protein
MATIETYYLIFNGGRKARVVKPRWGGTPDLRPDETAFRIKIEFPERRRVAGDIELVIAENVVTVDGVEMIPLKTVIFMEPVDE